MTTSDDNKKEIIIFLIKMTLIISRSALCRLGVHADSKQKKLYTDTMAVPNQMKCGHGDGICESYNYLKSEKKNS